MALRSAVLALLSIALIAGGIGLAYLELALPAVILGGLGFVLAVGWLGSVLLEDEHANSRSPSGTERQRNRSKLDQIRRALQLKYGEFRQRNVSRRAP